MIASDEIFNTETNRWKPIGASEPTLFISTELEIDELQTMAMAFITGINENEFLTGEFDFAYYDRIKYGAEVLSRAPLKIEVLPNFKIKDIENMIKRYVRQGYRYIFFDYIHTSLGILEEIGQRTHGVSMREDSVLFLLGSRLKEMAVQFGIHITSSTQLNGDWKGAVMPDQNLLRGAKSLGDRIDMGSILLNATEEDEEGLGPFLKAQGFEMPNVKLSIYKNRRGELCNCYIWMYANKGTCRFNPAFVTDWWYRPITVEQTLDIWYTGE